MKVCRITGEVLPPLKKIKSGLTPNYHYLSENLGKLGVRNIIVAGGYPKYPKLEKTKYYDIIRIKSTRRHRAFFNLGINLQAWKEIQKIKNQVDIIHIHDPYGIWIEKLKSRLKLPIVVTLHKSPSIVFAKENDLDVLTKVRLNLRDRVSFIEMKKMLENADGIICVSEQSKKEVLELFNIDKNKIVAIYNGFDEKSFYPRKVKKFSEKYDLDLSLLFVGNVRPVKGLKYLLQAMANLKDKKIKLFIAGGFERKSYEKYFWNLADELDIKDNIVFLKSIEHNKLPQVYSASDVLVLPSLSEGLPKVIVESYACATPVIASSVGGIPEIVKENFGKTTKPKDVGELTRAIESYLSNKKSIKRMGNMGRKFMTKNLTWKKIAQKHLEFYKKFV